MVSLVQEWHITQLCYEVDVEPYAQTRDATINQLAVQAGVAVAPYISHTLYVSGWLPTQNHVVHASTAIGIPKLCLVVTWTYLTVCSDTILHAFLAKRQPIA